MPVVFLGKLLGVPESGGVQGVQRSGRLLCEPDGTVLEMQDGRVPGLQQSSFMRFL